MQRIYYCAAPTGSGKTHAIEERIAQLTDAGETVVLVQPTVALARQTKSQIFKRFPSVHVEAINKQTVEGKVSTNLINYLKRPYDGPHCIIVTWVSFVSLPDFDRPERFHLICDEVPSAFECFEKRLPDNHYIITSALHLEPIDTAYAKLIIKNHAQIRKTADNRRGDAVADTFRQLSERLYQGKYDTYVDIGSYDNLLKGSRNHRWLRAFSMIKSSVFDGFKSVTVVGARATDTIFFKWFKSRGVNFVEDRQMVDSLRYREHPNGHLIDFFYLSETNWSLSAQDADPEIRCAFQKAVINLLGSEEYCWLDNKPYEADSPFNEVELAHKLPHSSHGLNSFLHVNNAAIMTALNYCRNRSNFLSKFCGIDRREQKIAFDYISTYQAYCRTSVRDPANEERKTIILPDGQNAAWQHELFNGSSLNSLGVDYRQVKKRGPEATYRDANERQRACRERKKMREQNLQFVRDEAAS